MADSVCDIAVNRIDGQAATLAAYRNKVLLIVNVASKCGLTPQYEGLGAQYEGKSADGLEVLGFPANDLAGQEPGTEAEIAEFCSTEFSVKFPLFGKISVKGPEQHPLYMILTSAKPDATGEGPMRERVRGYGMNTGQPGEVL